MQNSRVWFSCPSAYFSLFLLLARPKQLAGLPVRSGMRKGQSSPGRKLSSKTAAIADQRSVISDTTGNLSVPSLPPANYEVRIQVGGFTPAVFHGIRVGLNGTATVNAVLQVAQSNVEVNVTDAPPLVRSDSSELSTTLDSRR